MPQRSPSEIAEVFRDVALALELTGESRFRAAAYEKGAAAVEAMGESLDVLIRDDRLEEAPGIGKALAKQIAALRHGERSDYLDTLEASLPPGALALARGPSLSLRAIKTLSDAGFRSLEALRSAAAGGRLRGLPGFTAKTEARIVAAMQDDEDRRGALLLVDARGVAAEVAAFLLSPHSVDEIGALRLGHEIVSEVGLLATGDNPETLLARFVTYPRIATVLERDPDRMVVALRDGARVRLEVRRPEARAAALQRLTGNVAHNEAFDREAARAGIRVAPGGVERHEGGRWTSVAVATEEDLYRLAGLAYVPPLLRQGDGEVDIAARTTRAPRLVEIKDVRGLVHCHSDYSDGKHTIEQMARAADTRGFEYITITDHSPTASYAHGVELDRLARQWDEIARVQEHVKVRILRGTESDILKEGSLDYPDTVLEKLDVIIASIHNRYKLDRREMTARVVRAMRHPLFKIWGHGLGRLLLRRPPIDCDVGAILEAVAESNAAIEINGDPHRLDLEPRYCKMAKALGIRFVLSVDAHATNQLDYVALALTMAQRAGLGPEDVLNTRDARGFADAVRPTGARASA